MRARVLGWCLTLGRGIAVLAGVCLVLPVEAAAQSATVVFYSHGSGMSSGFPSSKHGVFDGHIFDGEQYVFSFRDGYFVRNNRFLAFRFSPGPHTFSASYANHPDPKREVTLTLEGGRTYFLRAQSEAGGIVALEMERGRLAQMSCDVVQRETKKAKPLPASSIAPKMAANVVETQTVPACQ